MAQKQGTDRFTQWRMQNIYKKLPGILHDTKNEYAQMMAWEIQTGRPIMAEIELFAGELSALTFQIIKTGTLTVNPEESFQWLKTNSVFHIDSIVQWYENSQECPKTKSYVDTLDYLRLLIIEYLEGDESE